MVSTEGYIILGFFLTLLVIVLSLIFWPKPKYIREFYKKMNGIGKMKQSPYKGNTVFVDEHGEPINTRKVIPFIVQGNRLEYKGIKEDSIIFIDPNYESLKKGDMVIIPDWSIWEIKTCHKSGNYTLQKGYPTENKMITKRVKKEDICGRIKYA
jgi:hypothetical protein